MRNSIRNQLCHCLWISIQLWLFIRYSEAEAVTKRITRRPGESLQVKCPSLTVGEVRATSFVKQKGDVYVTLFSKLARNPIKKVPNTATHATLDETKRIMTVSKLSMKDDGMTFSCKLVSLHQELTNSVHVTIVVAPKITIRMSPKAPYRNNTSVTIICEVARVNPPLKGDRVTLSIGRDSYGITKVRRNSDMTWRYTTTKSYYITRAAHDRKLVTCSAKTRGGASRKLEKTARLRFIRPPEGTPRLTASSSVIRAGDELILRCILRDLGVPAANTYLFYQKGKLVKRNGPYSKLTVKISSAINEGSYTCKVANSEGASNFSNSVCIAFTTTKLPGKGIPLWFSVLSILLNIAALVYICMFYVKPRVLKFVDDFRNKSKSSLYSKDGFRLNKEENQTTEKVPKGVKVIYGDKPPCDSAGNHGFSITKLSKAKSEKPDEKKEAISEAIDDVLPEPLPEPTFVKDPRAPQPPANPTEAYEDLRL